MQRKQFAQMLIRYFSFITANAEKIASRITADTYNEAMQKLVELRQRFQTTYVKDKAAYTYKTLDSLIKDHEVPNTKVEEMK